MRILVLTSTYPRYENDPTAPFIESLVRHTAQLGHEIHLVVPEHRDWDRPLSESGVHFHPFRYSPSKSWTPWGYGQSLRDGVRLKRSLVAIAPVVFASAVHACRTVAKKAAIDVAHAHWVLPNGPIAAHAVGPLRVPLAITVHGSDVTIAKRSRWMRRAAAYSLRRAAAVTAVSRYMLHEVEALGADPRQLELIPLGTDLAAFHPDAESARRVRGRLKIGPEQTLVLGIGRLIAWKGFEHLIDAHRYVRDETADVHLVIAGDGDLRTDLVKRAARLGVGDSVTFVGAVDRDEVAGYYAAADVVAVPSIRHERGFVEGLGYVALEALASGTPVVATRVGGLPEVVSDGQSGLLVAEQDPVALANAILALARDQELRRRMGAEARTRALAAPSWAAVAQLWVELYERIIDARGRRVGFAET